LSVENQYLNETHTEHYIDMGCICVACCNKRQKVMNKLRKGEKMEGKIIHEEAKLDLVRDKINVIKRQLHINKSAEKKKLPRSKISFTYQK